jgi:hypothetical protein
LMFSTMWPNHLVLCCLIGFFPLNFNSNILFSILVLSNYLLVG